MLVKEYMLPINTPIKLEDTLQEVCRMFDYYKVDGLPVADRDGKIAGILYYSKLFKNIMVEKMEFQSLLEVIDRNYHVLTESTEIRKIWEIDQSTFIILDADGKLIGLLDKTLVGKSLFERAMRMMEQVQIILDSAHNGIIAIDNKGKVTIFNKAAEKITWRPRHDAIGKHISQVIIPQELLEVSHTGVSQISYKYTVEFSKCKRVYVSNRTPIIENGKIVGAIGVFQDVSEIEFIIEELDIVKGLNQELEAIIDSCYDGILVVNEKGIIEKANKAHERITGILSKDILRRDFNFLLDKNIYSTDVFLEVFKKNKVINIIETTPKCDLVITGCPIRDNEGKIRKIVINVRDLTELNILRRELEQSREISNRYKFELCHLRKNILSEDGKIFSSKKMLDLLSAVHKIAKVDSTVLILGESGVGKEVIAKLIHKYSSRPGGPFITINCGAIPENLLESELFGYEGGAFTGASREGKPGIIELAHNGTLLLDEIADLPIHLQVKILRAIQEKEVFRIGGKKPRPINIRILAATNKNLENEVKEGRFREDLYFRINVIPIIVLPLRERKDDIIPIVNSLIKKYKMVYNIDKTIDKEVTDFFLDYDWPGNIRELENIMERLFVTSNEDKITMDDLPKNMLIRNQDNSNKISVKGIVPLKEAIEEVERQLIGNALLLYGTTYKAAEALKINQSTIVRKSQQLRINRDY